MNRFAKTLATLPVLLMAACTPQNAKLVTGEYWAFMSEATSFSILNEVIDPTEWDDQWNIDCRVFDSAKDKKVLRLPDAYEVCHCAEGVTPDSGGCEDAKDAQAKDVGWPPVSENWMQDSGFYVLHEALDPWRGEAIVTSEGDLQIGFHHRLPGGQDFRFAIAVDPAFQPQICVPDGAGGVKSEPVDGDWVEHWTEDLRNLAVDDDNDGASEIDGDCDDFDDTTKVADGACHGFDILSKFATRDSARLFYLTARGFQFNPADMTDYWSIPEEWRAGFANGKFAAEQFHARAPRWGLPVLYEFVEAGFGVEDNPADLYYCDYDCIPADEVIITEEDPDPPTPTELEEEFDECVAEWNECMDTKAADARNSARLAAAEWAQVRVGVPKAGSDPELFEPIYQPMVHSNLWREDPDTSPAGFDGWTEYHPSYVVLDGQVEPGEPLTGAFQIVFDGDESNSRWLIRGEFEVDRLKKDRWVTDDLRADKHEQNGTTRCNLNLGTGD